MLVKAYDSGRPNDVSRVTVKFTILSNEHPPLISPSMIFTTANDYDLVNTPIVKVNATDLDTTVSIYLFLN